MINKKLLLLLLGGSLLNAQTINETNAAAKVSGKTGINTKVPTRTLTVENTTANQGKPVLRLVDTPKYSANVNSDMDADLGGNTQNKTSYFDYKPLVMNNVGDVYQGVPMTNNTGIITLEIDNVDEDYVSNFNTGIDFRNYFVAILGAQFLVPDYPANNEVAMLVTSKEIPDTSQGNSKIGASTVFLFEDTATHTWSIYADYPNMGVKKTTTGAGHRNNISTKANGRWIISLLVGKRELVNYARVYYDQHGGATGNGMSDAAYRAEINKLLNRLE
ncbi:MAG: hypothetical protein HG446_001935 [Flavobacteriaceae bacterium]|jgi:hypothetical protein|nr:hypothetical protein [Flavobacteriaceae bacterium]